MTISLGYSAQNQHSFGLTQTWHLKMSYKELSSEMRVRNSIVFFVCFTLAMFRVSATNPEAKIPSLSDRLDTLQFIEQVRRFVAEHSDDGLYLNALTTMESIYPVKQISVPKVIQVFDRDESVASCATASAIMTKILLDNGIDAYTYNFGFRNTEYSHTVVLAKCGGKLCVFDPYLNYTLYNSDGTPMDIFDLFSMIHSGDMNFSVSRDTAESDMLLDDILLNNLSFIDSLRNIEGCTSFLGADLSSQPQFHKYRFKRCYQCEIDRCYSFIARFEKRLTSNTGYTQFHQGYMLKIGSIDGATDWPIIDQRLNQALCGVTD